MKTNNLYADLISLKKEYDLDRIELDIESNRQGKHTIVIQIKYNTKKYSLWLDDYEKMTPDEMMKRTEEFIINSVTDAKEWGYEK